MNILVVYAHPEPQSFCSSMKDLAVSCLAERGHVVRVSDLYEMSWNPIASAEDFMERKDPGYLVYALEQRAAYASGDMAEDIAGQIGDLCWADLLIFIFPLYWCSVPAILKGWFDRVLVSGLCYGGKRFYDKGGLVGKRAVLNFTAGAKAHMFRDEQAVHGDLDFMLRPLERGTLAYTGMGVLPRFVAYNIPYVSDRERLDILANYKRYLIELELLDSMGFPSLDDYESDLYPKF
ncbi:NAD(P)H-dependent oxidoreductase [Pseudomonas monteilii]|uniref:Flavodoxin family protein n=1 Tax=Pseudomonas monteilii TaxID=76759 RepID=A0A399MC11_9PSED|nr:NAD(P)H-dependent oxidoreductase [Pseudomonas monteilii]RII78266.1 flavodoxin family protein [Pseudomonas monteilii]